MFFIETQVSDTGPFGPLRSHINTSFYIGGIYWKYILSFIFRMHKIKEVDLIGD